MNRLAVAFVLLGLPAALAQGHQPAPTSSPYSGLEQRAIKALSEQQIADLRAGRGMGFALPAELNGYPGPIHVLELAAQLDLTDAQRRRMHELMNAMQAEAIPIGEEIIAREAELDHQFAGRTATPTGLEETTAQIGRLQGALRAAHLKYHLMTLDALTATQVARYAELRGYSNKAPVEHNGRHHR
jgi:Spy/CpxP family protein refolding chaperone